MFNGVVVGDWGPATLLGIVVIAGGLLPRWKVGKNG